MAQKAMFEEKDTQPNSAHNWSCKQTLFYQIRVLLSITHIWFHQFEDFDCGKHVAEGPKHEHYEDFLMYSWKCKITFLNIYNLYSVNIVNVW